MYMYMYMYMYIYIYTAFCSELHGVPAKHLTLEHTCMQIVHSAMKTERQRDRHTIIVVGAQLADW